MFVFLSKFLPLLVYPIGLTCLLILIALIFSEKRRVRNTFMGLALIMLWVGGNRWVSASLVRSLETKIIPPVTIPAADMIVVLGGGTESYGPPRAAVELNGAGDRVLYAARLYREGIAPRLLLSGGNITWLGSRPSTPAEEMKEVLVFMGIPEDALWLQPNSQNTYEDALFSARMLKEEGIKRIVLVTSAMHMPRSAALFEKQGIEVIPAPADFAVPDYAWQDLWNGDFPAQVINLLPNVGALSQTTNALKEYFGLWMYSLRGWL
jgi:uncharacterized SAM-binding protein YcdF (DUF218 family)